MWKKRFSLLVATILLFSISLTASASSSEVVTASGMAYSADTVLTLTPFMTLTTDTPTLPAYGTESNTEFIPSMKFMSPMRLNLTVTVTTLNFDANYMFKIRNEAVKQNSNFDRVS